MSERVYWFCESTPPPRPGDRVTLPETSHPDYAGRTGIVDTAKPDGRGEPRKLTVILDGPHPEADR